MPRKQFEKIRAKFRELLYIKGSPHTIALGAAVGVFWNFIPSLGIGPFLSMGLARMIGASTVSALTANLATGFFIPIMYSMNMLTGRVFMGGKVETKEIEESLQDSFQESIDRIEGVVEQPSAFFSLDRLQDFTADFLIGALVNALIAAAVIYFVFWVLLKWRFKKKLALIESEENLQPSEEQRDV